MVKLVHGRTADYTAEAATLSDLSLNHRRDAGTVSNRNYVLAQLTASLDGKSVEEAASEAFYKCNLHLFNNPERPLNPGHSVKLGQQLLAPGITAAIAEQD